MSDIKIYDGHGRCYSADQIAQIARFIEGGRPEGLRLYPINGAPGRFLVDAEQFDAQRLRADTAEADLLRTSDALIAAEQRIANHESILRRFANCADVRQVGTLAMDYVAVLNQRSEAKSHDHN